MPHPPTSAPPPRSARPTTVSITDDHTEALAHFYRAVWDEHATPHKVAEARRREAAENFVRPGVTPVAFAMVLEDRIIGYLGTLPARFWNGKEEIDADWMKGFMVLPEYRGGPVGFQVLKHGTNSVGVAAGIMVADPARRLFGALGYRDLGCLSNHILPLRPGRMLHRLDLAAVAASRLPGWALRLAGYAKRTGVLLPIGALAGVALNGWRTIANSFARGPSTRVGWSQVEAAALDALWHRVRQRLPAAHVRDSAYLQWRYRRHGDMYELISAWEGESLVGVAVVRRARSEGGDERLRGVRVATLSDILYDPDSEHVARGLAVASSRHAIRIGADALLCSVSHPAPRDTLRAAGFMRLPGNVALLVRDPSGRHAFPETLDAWWVTRGDAHSDETF